MVEPHVSLDPDALPPTARHLHKPLEAQLSSALQVAAQEVEQQYDGEPVAEVSEQLLSTTRESLHPDIAEAFQPDAAELHRVAEAIVAEAGEAAPGDAR
ncbi:MAG TPA: hypothetical protein VK453_16045 [Micromonosporaceae bacterium]|nr:hypothetical protein [Micromonosporaceae bacterium]